MVTFTESDVRRANAMLSHDGRYVQPISERVKNIVGSIPKSDLSKALSTAARKVGDVSAKN